MGMKQLQRGMRYRLKTMPLRLRIQVRLMARHRKAQAAALSCETAPQAGSTQDPRRTEEWTAQPSTTLPLPTLRRRSSPDNTQ